MAIFVVMLRAIGPVTHKIMSMAQWREGVEADGFVRAETYLATGNMIVEGEGSAAEVTKRMNGIIRRLGLPPNCVAVVRTPGQMAKILAADPFPEASLAHPDQMGVYFFAGGKPDFGWTATYEGHEKLAVVGKHLVVDYSGRISESLKLPGIIEKRSGTATARNWNTLRGLAERGAAHKKDH